MRLALRLVLAGCLGLVTALLMSCGGGGASNLIPAGNAGPLKNDFDAVAQDVASGNCAKAAADVSTAQTDLANLPSSVDTAVLAQLRKGVDNLAARAPIECAQVTTATAPTTATTVTTSPTTATTQTTTTPTQTTPTTPTTPTTTTPPPTTPTTSPNNGGIQAPGSGGGQGNGGSGGAQGNGQ